MTIQPVVQRPVTRRTTLVRMGIMLVLVTVVFGGVFGMKYNMNKGMNEYLNHMPVQPAAVSTTKAEAQKWDDALETVGSLVAINGADVTTEVGGIVTAIRFESGAHVEKGQPLVSLESSTEAAELRQLEAQATLSDLNRARREKLFKLEAISKSDVDAVTAEADAARAAVAAQKAKLAQKDIRAPFSGQLGIRRVNVGEYLSPGTPIVSVQAVDPIDVDFSLPEQRVGVVRPGFKVQVSVEALPGRMFEGQVLAIEQHVDAATRNFTVRARLSNPGTVLQPGQSAKVRLGLSGSQEVIVVPRTAIDYSAYGSAVFVVQKKKGAPPRPQKANPGDPPWTDLEVTQRFVKTGDARGDFVTVTEGLKAGEEIATSGLLKLRNEYPVIINNDVKPDVHLDPRPVEN